MKRTSRKTPINKGQAIDKKNKNKESKEKEMIKRTQSKTIQ